MVIRVIQFCPSVDATAFGGATIVVIDVLRATTTIASALANGAREIVPVSSVEDALRIADGEADRPLLAGESQNAPIPGFDLGNSPSLFTPDRVHGKRVVFRTTNGTQVLRAFSKSANVLSASFSNLDAVTRWLVKEAAAEVVLVCAGQDAQFSLEDFLCAGAIIDRLEAKMPVTLDDAAIAARGLFRASEGRLEATMRSGNHAQSLIDSGMGDDIAFATRIDRYDVVPRLTNGTIVDAAVLDP